MPIGLSTKNVFDLVHHFGNEEDQISANFGFILNVNKNVLLEFLKLLDIPVHTLSKKDIKSIDIETQAPYTFKNKHGKIDLQIKLSDKFLIFLESKLGLTPLGKDQLKNYSVFLNNERAFYDNLRLVFITQFDRKKEYIREINYIGLNKIEFKYFRWQNIVELLGKVKSKNNLKFINNLFTSYIGDKMADKKTISEQKIGNVKEVLINSTDADWWEHVKKTRTVCNYNNIPDAQYVAIYRTSPISAITHIAKVKYTEKNVLPRETYKKFPRILKKGKDRGWLDMPHKVFHIDELIELPRHIAKEKGDRGVIRNIWFKTLPEILKAKTLSDLKK